MHSWNKHQITIWIISLLIIGIIVIICVLNTTDTFYNNEIYTKINLSELSTDQLITTQSSLPLRINFLESEILQEIDKRQSFETISINKILSESTIISKYINKIIFINSKQNEVRKEAILKEIEKFIEPNIYIERFETIERDNIALGCALSHLMILLQASISKENILILEDDWELLNSKEELIYKFELIESQFIQNRWDVIVFGQNVKSWSKIQSCEKIIRLLESTTCGYLVNKDYAQILFNQLLLHISSRINLKQFQLNDYIDQFQLTLQKQHFWIGFYDSIGKQKSIIDSKNIKYPLQSDFILQKIAICLVATGRYIHFVENIKNDLFSLFCRPHSLRIFLFSDSNKEFNNVSNYFIPRNGFPYDTLHRYDFILKAKEELKEYDYIFYLDVDYRILEYVSLENIIKNEGLVVTSHLHGIQDDNIGHNHIGTPDTNPNSTACIHNNEKMLSYFAGGFQGGSCDKFLNMCQTISNNILIDEINNVQAIWHDESHLNRYFVDNIPESILSQSFIYPEHCLDELNLSQNCINLRKRKIRPIMVPLDKDHTKVRSIE